MRLALKLHPNSFCTAVTGVDVDVTRPHDGNLSLSYITTGKIADLRLPLVAVSARADELWRSSCFEAFIRAAPGEAYYEFNFAPSTQWAAYRFDGYRTGMRAASEIAAPRIEVQSAPECYTLRATLDLANLPTPSLRSPRAGEGREGDCNSASRRSSKKPAAGNHIGRWRIRRASRISIMPIALLMNFASLAAISPPPCG